MLVRCQVLDRDHRVVDRKQQDLLTCAAHQMAAVGLYTEAVAASIKARQYKKNKSNQASWQLPTASYMD